MSRTSQSITLFIIGALSLAVTILQFLHFDELETALYGIQTLSLRQVSLLTRLHSVIFLAVALYCLSRAVWTLVRKRHAHRRRAGVMLGIISILVAIVVPFLCIPSDALYNRFVPQTRNSIEASAFAELQADSAVQALGIDTSTCVVGVLSTGCYYCRLSATKVNYLMNRCKLPTDKFKMILIGSPRSVEHFLRISGAGSYPHAIVNQSYTFNAIHGSFPTFILMQNGKVAGVYDFRGIDEQQWNAFLGGKL